MLERWFWIGLLLLSLAGGVAAFVLVAYPEPRPEEKVITIEARQFKYSPNIIEVDKGDRVRLRLISRDVFHGFYLDSYGVEAKVKRGEVSEVSFIADKPGRFSFRCSVTCGEFHPYLIGYLEVKPNTPFYGGVLGALGVGLAFALGTLPLSRRHNKDNLGSSERLLGVIPLGWRWELTRFKVVRQALKSRWFPFLGIVLNLFVFTLILLASLVGSPAGNYNFAMMVLWLLWWVLLIVVLVPFFGRLWCAVCPLPALGEWLQRLRLIGVTPKPVGLNRRWPRRLSNLWPPNFVFLALILLGGFFTVRPMATFYVLALLIAAAAAVSLVYQKRTFCLYLCPVSAFQSLYANFSLSEVRPRNHEICRKHRPKTCFTGNEKGYGCPWLCVPSSLERNTYCGMCLECFKTCPYDNMAWNIRPPGVDLLVKARRGLDEAWNAFIMLGVAIAFYVVMQGPWAFLKDWARAESLWGYIVYISGLIVFIVLFLPLVFFAFAYLSKRLSHDREVPLKGVFVNFSYALVPLGLATWVAFAMGKVFPNGSYLIGVISDPFAWGWDLFGTAGFKWHPFLTRLMPYLQTATLIVGLIFALEYGYKIARQTYADERARKRGWLPILTLLLGVTVFLIGLFGG